MIFESASILILRVCVIIAGRYQRAHLFGVCAHLFFKLATDPQKRGLFAGLSNHLNVLALEVERAIAEKLGEAKT